MNIKIGQYIFRSLLLQSFWNYRKMQNIGMLFIMYPYLSSLYPEKDKFFSRAILRNLEAFNTNPVMVSFCVGAVMKQEKVLSKVTDKLPVFYEQEREWLTIRSSIATTVASLGDRLFWSTLKPLSLAFAFAILCLWQVPFLSETAHVGGLGIAVTLAAILALLVYNVPVFITRYKGFQWGYDGTEDNFFGLIEINWNKIIIVLKTIGQILTTIIFLYGVYSYFSNFNLDFNLVTKVILMFAFVVLSIFIKKWDIPNIYLYLASVIVFTIAALIF